jgi:ketosteroid isomerase-like protein
LRIDKLLAGSVVASVVCWASLAEPKLIRLSLPQTSAQEDRGASAAAELEGLEHRVDDAIRDGDTTFLQSVFAGDFRFLHFNGEITNKAESLQQVSKRPYTLRHLDAVKIEMHGDVAVTDGLVDISAHGEHGNHSYLMKYVRVYQRRNGHWQMLMQHSVGETSPIAFDIPSSK